MNDTPASGDEVRTGLARLAQELNGRPIPGGCDYCDAEQRLAEMPGMTGGFNLTVAHSDGCPWYAARNYLNGIGQ